MPAHSDRRPGSIKITDVAHAAGVAPMTVSRVLNAPDRVSRATADRVLAAIERLGYVPNLIAGGLSSRRSRMIAAVVPTIASQMFSDPVQSFTDRLEQAGYQVMLALSGYDRDEAALVRAILSRRPDGLMLTGANHSDRVRGLLLGARVPVVEIWDTAEHPLDMLVGFDHADVGMAVATHFARRGFTRFAVVGADDPRATARRHGFARGVAQHGGALVAERVVPAPARIAAARDAVRALLPAPGERLALFCSSDLAAFGAITEARIHGIEVPGRLGVCGFGDFELSRAAEPAITTVSVDGATIGRTAAEFLIARLGGDASQPRMQIGFRIVQRSS